MWKRIVSEIVLTLPLLMFVLTSAFNINPIGVTGAASMKVEGIGDSSVAMARCNGDNYVLSVPHSSEAVSVAASFDGRSCIYGDTIVFSVAETQHLCHYNISSATLTDTEKSCMFPSIYKNVVAFLVPEPPYEIHLYDIYTGTLVTVSYPHPLEAKDFVDWTRHLPEEPMSIFGDVVAFYDSEGVWYFNRSQTPVKINNIGGGRGVSVCGDLIAYSDITIRYFNLTNGVSTDTGVAGVAPSMFNNIITFDDPPTVKYYNMSNETVTDTMVIGDFPTIHGRYIAFSTSEATVGEDLNNDGDTNDSVIRYCNTLTGKVTNTTEVGQWAEIYGDTISFRTDNVIKFLRSKQIASMVADLTGGTPNPWDFVPDNAVDGSDLIVVSRCYGSSPTSQPPMKWHPNCDINNDNVIDGSDMIIVSRYYGENDL